jgi:hypothetical protein
LTGFQQDSYHGGSHQTKKSANLITIQLLGVL